MENKILRDKLRHSLRGIFFPGYIADGFGGKI